MEAIGQLFSWSLADLFAFLIPHQSIQGIILFVNSE